MEKIKFKKIKMNREKEKRREEKILMYIYITAK